MSDLKNTPTTDAVIVVQLEKMMRARRSSASANGEMRNVFKDAESKGVHLGAAKTAVKIYERNSEEKLEEIVEQMVRTIAYLRLLGVNLTKQQMELFEFDDKSRLPLVEKAYEAGLVAGRLGKPDTENPHQLNTDAGQSWMKGFNAGAAERRAIFAMGPDAPSVIPGAADEEDEDGDDDLDDALESAAEDD